MDTPEPPHRRRRSPRSWWADPTALPGALLVGVASCLIWWGVTFLATHLTLGWR